MEIDSCKTKYSPNFFLYTKTFQLSKSSFRILFFSLMHEKIIFEAFTILYFFFSAFVALMFEYYQSDAGVLGFVPMAEKKIIVSLEDDLGYEVNRRSTSLSYGTAFKMYTQGNVTKLRIQNINNENLGSDCG